MSNDRYVINSVLRAAMILESFNFNKSTYTNSELSKKLGLSKSMVTRLLCSLEKAGFIERDSKTKEFRLTHRLFRIGNVYISQIDFHKEAMPLLLELSTLSKETVHLAILNQFRVFYLDKVDSFQSIRMASRSGNTAPSYCTGVGKVLLANLNEYQIENFFRSIELIRYTPNTICNPEELKLHLKRIRGQGFAIDDSEHEVDIKCVAAPIRDKNSEVIAAISIAGPSFRMVREKIEDEFISAVKKTVKDISKRLGYVER